MSCGDERIPGQFDPSQLQGECSSVMHDVWAFLDNELDPARRAAVQRHLDECSPCLEEAGIDLKLKALLARKCGGDHAPEALRSRIAEGLIQWSRTVTSQTVVSQGMTSQGVISRSVSVTSVHLSWTGDEATGGEEGTAGETPAVSGSAESVGRGDDSASAPRD